MRLRTHTLLFGHMKPLDCYWMCDAGVCPWNLTGLWSTQLISCFEKDKHFLSISVYSTASVTLLYFGAHATLNILKNKIRFAFIYQKECFECISLKNQCRKCGKRLQNMSGLVYGQQSATSITDFHLLLAIGVTNSVELYMWTLCDYLCACDWALTRTRTLALQAASTRLSHDPWTTPPALGLR